MRKVIGALAILMVAATTGNPMPPFRAVARSGSQTFLLDEHSRNIYASVAAQLPRAVTGLVAGARPFRWRVHPFTFALWRDSWLVANGTDELTRFSRAGAYQGTVRLPIEASNVVASGARLWIYSISAHVRGSRFWSSVDGVRFDPVRASFVDERAKPPAKLLEAHALLAAAPGDRIAMIRSVGAPELRFVSADGTSETMQLAYSRTRERDGLTRFKKDGFLLTRYSSPASDLVAQDDQVIVLRNREDVRVNGVTQTVVGQRIDKYVKGRHVATAEFPETVRWILGADTASVSGITLSRTVIRAKWSAPQPSAIIE